MEKAYWADLLSKHHHYFTLNNKKFILDAGCGPAGIYKSLEGNKETAFDPLINQ
jgi:hypothetical protein